MEWDGYPWVHQHLIVHKIVVQQITAKCITVLFACTLHVLLCTGYAYNFSFVWDKTILQCFENLLIVLNLFPRQMECIACHYMSGLENAKRGVWMHVERRRECEELLSQLGEPGEREWERGWLVLMCTLCSLGSSIFPNAHCTLHNPARTWVSEPIEWKEVKSAEI